MSTVVSFRIDRELKRRMEELRHINWSEVVRRAIARTVEEEMAKRRRGKDRERMRRASLRCREISRRVEGWSSTEEIRRWRERRPTS
ncbi:VapB-type antitoxin [Candidatus Bathyarchaeota archaeon]|nr:VapB-type antitoxin [Candidatus Bathyarchaeota archaeon]RLI17618.1 MAG: VapB-type antitoxin [Candidatus Bathyarchaeota archaeon]